MNPQADGHADQPEGPGPLLRRGDVGQDGAGGGGGATADPVDQARHEHQRQRQARRRGAGPELLPGQADGEGEQAEPQHRSRHADRDHGLAAEPIAHGADQGGDGELGQGIGAPQQADRQAEIAAVRAEAGQQERQQRKDDALAEPIVEQGEKGAQQR